MKNNHVASATVASFEMGVENSDTLPRLPLRSQAPESLKAASREREFLLDAFSKLCRKRGRQSARCTFAKKQ